jgi:polysaccharide export outer membrane protein
MMGGDLTPATPRGLVLVGLLAVLLQGCLAPALPSSRAPRPTGDFVDIPYATWTNAEPAYRLYPGDILEIAAPSAPELARTVTVQPDGRISLPFIAPVMAADRTVVEMERLLSKAYAPELLDPRIEVSVKQASPLKVFIGGEVRTPGVYDMPGDVNALQGVIMAGGFTPAAKRGEVVVLRRGPDGRAMMRTVDLRRAVFDPASGDALPLRRFDIVYVPRSGIGEVDQFIDLYVRQALPLQFSYAVGREYGAVP